MRGGDFILRSDMFSNIQNSIIYYTSKVKYILMMSDNSSVTWAVHVRILCQTYQLPDPLALMEGDLWPKNRWKSHIQTAIRVHHEALLRRKALSNSKLTFLNIQLTGLAGRHHPILSGVHTAQDVVKLRPHVKMLAGDYLSFSTLARERGGNPECRLCPSSSFPRRRHDPHPYQMQRHS